MTVILHFSDLHFGPHSRFAADDPGAVAKRFFAEIAKARAEAKLAEVELVVVTGDLTEAARKAEFEAAAAFFEALVGELGLERRRFVFVPGNHDVSWAHCKRVRADQEFEGFDDDEALRRIQAVKLEPWRAFLDGFYAQDDADRRRALAPGLVVHDFSRERLSVAAIDSCERETELVHGGYVGEPLAASLMSERNREDRRAWLKLIAVHTTRTPSSARCSTGSTATRCGPRSPATCAARRRPRAAPCSRISPPTRSSATACSASVCAIGSAAT